MATVYSTRFIVTKGQGGTGPSVTVPAGFVYVVKQVTAYINPIISQTTVFFEDDDTGAALFRANATFPDSGWFGFFGTIVFEEGQGFHFQVDSTTGDVADVSAHGYALKTP
jgi:hypothetical protein